VIGRPGGAVPRAELRRLRAPEHFGWATGIEDTFIADAWPATGRRLDEYELTHHYRRWRGDLDLMRELGVGMARYGIPWYRVNPGPGRWNWRWADGPLERMLELGIDPIVDLVHYGAPQWIRGGFLDPSFPERMAEYAGRVAERFRGHILWYTPLNEPRIAAWYCGRLGWWPPYRRSWRGFVDIITALCRGIALSDAALRSVDDRIVPVHVDATDLYDPAEPELAAFANHRQALVFLALDLVTGAVTRGHRLYAWLRAHGVEEADLAWFRARRVRLQLLGLNMYPMFTSKLVLRTPWGIRIAMPRGGSDMVCRLVRTYARRYGCPVMITETASLGSVRRRTAWLTASVAAIRQSRERGVPVVGYTWWPMFALVAWAYRQGQRTLERHLLQMGLWNLDPMAKLRRVRTQLVDVYREMVADGSRHVGRIAATRSRRG
jgi:beta-glucosidase